MKKMQNSQATHDTVNGQKNTVVRGNFSDEFAPCAKAFEENFKANGELGAACSIYHKGSLVVDIWGGISNPNINENWSRHTVAPFFSVTKGIATICILILAERKLVALDSPISSYWPEFGVNGKQSITIREALAHRAGVPAMDTCLTMDDLHNSERVAKLLAKQVPQLEPSTSHMYHPITIGWITGELVKRTTGNSINKFLQEELCEPLGIDLWIGIPKEMLPHVAKMFSDGYSPDVQAQLQTGSLAWKSLTLNGLLPVELVGLNRGLNSPIVQTAELAGVSGIGNARSLAKLYSAVIGDISGFQAPISSELVKAACVPVSYPQDTDTDTGPVWGTGFLRPSKNQPMLGNTSFGHDGAGGSVAFADPASNITFAYVRNKMNKGGGPDLLINHVLNALKKCI